MSLPDLLPLDASTPVAPPLVSLRDVHLSFGITPVLSGINLDVQRGQAVSIIGPSGSGKSTLLRCISGLLRPQRGSITVDGIRVDQLNTEEDTIALRKRIGFVFQQYNLFPHLSVLDNLVAAPVRVLGKARSEAEATAHALLKKVGLADKARAYPGQLSGGQQQRVAIARALAMKPELILFDEVTSALDPETVGEVLNVIGELVDDGLTCVLVTHEMAFARAISDEVVFTEHGVVVERGSAEQVFPLRRATAHVHSCRARFRVMQVRGPSCMRHGTLLSPARRLPSDLRPSTANRVQRGYGRVLQRLLQISNQVIGIFQTDMQAQHSASLIPLRVVSQPFGRNHGDEAFVPAPRRANREQLQGIGNPFCGVLIRAFQHE